MSDPDDKPTAKDELRRTYRDDQASPKPPKPSTDWQSLVEEQIAKIDWSTVSGKGKPLNLDRNPYVDAGDELAHGVLKNAGFTLPWIDDARQIEADLAAARDKLRRSHAAFRNGGPGAERAWQIALDEFREQIARINRTIRDYNLKAPSPQVHKFLIRIEEELGRLGE